MNRFAIIEGDIVQATTSVANAYPIPAALAQYPSNALRCTPEGAIVDAATFREYFIDAEGTRHIAPLDPNWQPLTCAWDDVLICVDGRWRVQTPADQLTAAKQEAMEDIRTFAQELRQRAVHDADPLQVIGWADKAQRAQRLLRDQASEADCAMLQFEAEQRGQQETPEQLAQKQAGKAEKQAQAMALIDSFVRNTEVALASKRTLHTVQKLIEMRKTTVENALVELLN